MESWIDALVAAAAPVRGLHGRVPMPVDRAVSALLPTSRLAEVLADVAISHARSLRAWDWGEGLLLAALAGRQRRHVEFVIEWFAAHRRRGLPPIDASDACPPGLAALELLSRRPEAVHREVCDRIADYLHRAPRTSGGGLNHLGTRWYGRGYPRSMWVDSLMMYVVFAARWARWTDRLEWREFAADQVLAFAKVLQDPSTGLWRHAWYEAIRCVLPAGDCHWLRGNGWALTACVDVLETLPPEHPRYELIADMVRATARGLLVHHRPGSLLPTVLGRPSYGETSGSALVAYALLKGARLGCLDDAHRRAGASLLAAILHGYVRLDGPAPGMSGISDHTMPYPGIVYGLVPRCTNRPYGLAALLWAMDEACLGPMDGGS